MREEEEDRDLHLVGHPPRRTSRRRTWPVGKRKRRTLSWQVWQMLPLSLTELSSSRILVARYHTTNRVMLLHTVRSTDFDTALTKVCDFQLRF